MDENEAVEEEEDTTTYWWMDKPKGTVVAVAIVIFPLVLAYWGLALVGKKALLANNNRRFIKTIGRPMNGIEEVLYKMDLDRKFGI